MAGNPCLLEHKSNIPPKAPCQIVGRGSTWSEALRCLPLLGLKNWAKVGITHLMFCKKINEQSALEQVLLLFTGA